MVDARFPVSQNPLMFHSGPRPMSPAITVTEPHAHVRLEAVDTKRNMARAYEIHAAPDLFGATIVELAWGRIGTRGQSLTRSFSNVADATRYLRKIIARRMSAPKRLGVPYRIVSGRALQEMGGNNAPVSTNAGGFVRQHIMVVSQKRPQPIPVAVA